MGFWDALLQAGECYMKVHRGIDPAEASGLELIKALEVVQSESGRVNAVFGTQFKPLSKVEKILKGKEKGKDIPCVICGKTPSYDVSFLWGKGSLASSQGMFAACFRHWLLIHIGAIFLMNEGRLRKIYGSNSGSYAWFVLPEVPYHPSDPCELWDRLLQKAERGTEEEWGQKKEGISDTLAELFELLEEGFSDDEMALVLWNIGVLMYKQNAHTVYAMVPSVSWHYIRRLEELGGKGKLQIMGELKSVLKRYQRVAFSDTSGDWYARTYISAYTAILSGGELDLATLTPVLSDIAWYRLGVVVLEKNEKDAEYRPWHLVSAVNFFRFVLRYYNRILDRREYKTYRALAEAAYWLGAYMRKVDDIVKGKRGAAPFGELLLGSKARAIEDIALVDVPRIVAAMVGSGMFGRVAKGESGGDTKNEAEILKSTLVVASRFAGFENINIEPVAYEIIRAFLWAGYALGGGIYLEDTLTCKVWRSVRKGYLLGKLFADTPIASTVVQLVHMWRGDVPVFDFRRLLQWTLKVEAYKGTEDVLDALRQIGLIRDSDLADGGFAIGLMIGLLGNECEVAGEPAEPYWRETFPFALGYVWGKAISRGMLASLGAFRYASQLLWAGAPDWDRLFEEATDRRKPLAYYFGELWEEDVPRRVGDRPFEDMFLGLVKAVMENAGGSA